MDPISQGALGAVVAASAAPAKQVRLATLVGWAGGMLADLDVFIRSEQDPLLNIEYHRHFTHSLVFIPVGGLICAAVFWLFLRKRIGFGRLYLYSTLGYATAGLLDACTSYGTQLLWPFSDARIAWSMISIIDPIFTGTLLLLVVWSLIRSRSGPSRAACVFALLYLGFGVIQNHRANRAVVALAESRDHLGAQRFTVKPSIGNLALWRGIYEYNGFLHVDAIHVPYVGSDIEIYAGEKAPLVDLEALKDQLPDGSVLGRDLERFNHFSDGYLSWHPERANVIGDARYAMLPDSVEPLWGIEVNVEDPDRHAQFVTFRSADRSEFARLWSMVLGREGSAAR